jgi:hypothetical protein
VHRLRGGSSRISRTARWFSLTEELTVGPNVEIEIEAIKP